MSLVAHLKKSIFAVSFSALLTSASFANDEAALKLVDDAFAALKQGQIEQSTKLFDDALAQEGLTDPVKGEVLSKKANALLEIAWATRQDKPLLEAIETYKTAIEILDAETSPMIWADSNSKLGDAYRSLAYGRYNQNKPEEGAQLYNDAIVAFKNALEVFNKEDYPAEWATAQRALGQVNANSDTYNAIEGKALNAARLTEAANAFKAAMEVFTQDTDPVSWAGLQFQLGDIYSTLHQRQGGTLWLEKSVLAHKNVLEVLKEEDNPSVWAQVQYFIGNGLVELGAAVKNKEMLQDAITASKAATESDYFKNIFPEFYERNQINIQVAENLIKKYEAEE
ncbi:MAG: hypothetical protein JJ858_08800 [Rhizobiaceae bacterium]|nr:hypothetical protein [Rhizobiaceae bacterium]